MFGKLKMPNLKAGLGFFRKHVRNDLETGMMHLTFILSVGLLFYFCNFGGGEEQKIGGVMKTINIKKKQDFRIFYTIVIVLYTTSCITLSHPHAARRRLVEVNPDQSALFWST